MAIQMRRGDWNSFDPTRLLPGEFAVVTSSDPNTNDGKAVYICFAAGDVKRMSTFDDMYRQISDIEAEISDDLTEIVEIAVQEAHDAAVDVGNYGLRIGQLEEWAFNHDIKTGDLAEMQECCNEVKATLDAMAFALAELSGSWQYCNGILIAPTSAALTIAGNTATIAAPVAGGWFELD